VEYEKYVLGELQTNVYLLWDKKSSEGAIIDPSDEADFLAQKIQDKEINLKYILLTHGHFDHCLAALDLSLMFGVKIYVNQKDQFLLDRLAQTASWWLKRKVLLPPIKESENIDEGSRLDLGGEKISVIETPGHSPGGVCFWIPKEGWLFSGDTIFKNGGVGRTDLAYCSKEDLGKSIKKLAKLPQDLVLLPGHG
jgi:hydroxyacylglutathione hydrolase